MVLDFGVKDLKTSHHYVFHQYIKNSIATRLTESQISPSSGRRWFYIMEDNIYSVT